jgi:starch synthase
MGQADIFVHPAIWQEAFGLTITEAMASGCATVASRVGGIPEIIDDGVSGLLFPAGDVEALATALRLLLTDPVRRHRLGEAGRDRVRERFTLEGSVLGQLDWIERLGAPPP